MPHLGEKREARLRAIMDVTELTHEEALDLVSADAGLMMCGVDRINRWLTVGERFNMYKLWPWILWKAAIFEFDMNQMAIDLEITVADLLKTPSLMAYSPDAVLQMATDLRVSVQRLLETPAFLASSTTTATTPTPTI